VLDKRYVHPWLGSTVCAFALGRSGYGAVGGCDEERGGGGEEQGEMRGIRRMGRQKESNAMRCDACSRHDTITKAYSARRRQEMGALEVFVRMDIPQSNAFVLCLRRVSNGRNQSTVDRILECAL
jgi:hypothetical protein